MSIHQPNFARAPANAVSPNHPSDGEGIPAEVNVPTKVELTDPDDWHGDANTYHDTNPGITPPGSDCDPRSHRTPSVGDLDVDVNWVLTTEPRHCPPPAPPGVDGASFMHDDIPNQAFGGFQAALGIFHNTGEFGVSPHCNVFHAPKVHTMDSQI